MEASPLIAPAPWRLTGDGIIWLYKIPEAFHQRHGFLADFQVNASKTGIGAVLLMNYHSAEVGPYQELLYLPALFWIKGKLTFSVSKIYVSTHASAWNGRENWGIPKELADFNLLATPNGSPEVHVSHAGQPFFSARVSPWGPALPFSTRFFPLNRIVQQHRGQFLFTQPDASGHARLASTKNIRSDALFFPPVQELTPLATVSLNEFKMVFPVAEVL